MKLKDPIKPNKRLTKKPNFKKERLDEHMVFTINVGELNDSDVQEFIERMRTSMLIPQQYFGGQETEVVGVEQMRTQQEVENLYGQLGHPIGISSRSRQTPDGDIELLSYDLVASPPTRSAILGGEEMTYNASTWITIHKKKTRWERLKDKVSNIYRKWKRVG